MTASVEEWKRRYETARLAHEEARAEIERLDELLWQEAGNRVEIERLRRRLNEVDAQLTAESRIHARECMALRAEKDAEIEGLRAAGRDLLHAIGHDRDDLINEAVEKMRRALEPKP